MNASKNFFCEKNLVNMCISNSSLNQFYIFHYHRNVFHSSYFSHIFADHKIVACYSPRRGVQSFEQRRELPLPVYHNFNPFYRRFLAFITAQYINPPSTPPTVL